MRQMPWIYAALQGAGNPSWSGPHLPFQDPWHFLFKETTPAPVQFLGWPGICKLWHSFHCVVTQCELIKHELVKWGKTLKTIFVSPFGYRLFYFTFKKLFLLLFNYSCPHFSSFTLPCPTQPPLSTFDPPPMGEDPLCPWGLYTSSVMTLPRPSPVIPLPCVQILGISQRIYFLHSSL